MSHPLQKRHTKLCELAQSTFPKNVFSCSRKPTLTLSEGWRILLPHTRRTKRTSIVHAETKTISQKEKGVPRQGSRTRDSVQFQLFSKRCKVTWTRLKLFRNLRSQHSNRQPSLAAKKNQQYTGAMWWVDFFTIQKVDPGAAGADTDVSHPLRYTPPVA